MDKIRNSIILSPSSFGLSKLTEHGRRWKLNNGTGTDQIATEAEAASKSGSSSSSNRCCTKSKALSYGLSVSGTYDSNQLVKYSSLYKPIPQYTATFIANGGDFEAQYILITGVPTSTDMTRFLMNSGEMTYKFQEGNPIKINQPAGGATVPLNIGEKGYIYKINRGYLGSRIRTWTHENKDYTISWNQ